MPNSKMQLTAGAALFFLLLAPKPAVADFLALGLMSNPEKSSFYSPGR
jgi:hypothetical protein